MNLIDRVVGWVSPQRGFTRLAWRDALRHYDAGDGSRLNANWLAVNASAEHTDRYSRDTVRARARDLERNSDMLNGVVGAFVRNVVGGGFTLQAETGDTDLNQQLEKLWAQWCKKRNCDVTGTQSLSQLLRMAVRRKKVDGGMLFVKRYTGDGLLPFKLQAMEVDELDGSTIIARHKGNRVCGGIEYTPYNKPAGYWFRQYSLDGITAPEPVYVDAKDVIFYFSKRRPSQLREMSDMTQTLTRIRDANEFMVAEDTKQRIQACVALFIKKVNPTGLGRAGGRGYPGRLRRSAVRSQRQVRPGEAAGMKPLTFKEAVRSDVHGVFLNREEFACLHTVKYDGKVYADIPVSLQDVEQTERQQTKDDHLPGIFKAKSTLYCALEDIGGRLPEQGQWLEINDGRNPKFFNKYQVGSSGVELGMVRIELGRFAQ